MKTNLIKQSKSRKYLKYNDEIDLFLFLENLWEYKIKILAISFLACVMGFVFHMTTPKLNVLELKISPAKNFIFSEYYNLNQLIRSVDIMALSNSDPNPNSNANINPNIKTNPIINSSINIDNKKIFELFIQELSDYEEIFSSISSLDAIEENILNTLDKDNKSKIIKFYANKIKISQSNKTDDEYTLSIEWHDIDQSKDLLSNIIYSSLENTKKSIYIQIEQYANNLELYINNQIDSLKAKIESIFETQKLIEQKRLDHLYEQSVIARSLNLNNMDYKGNSLQLIDLSTSNTFPDYLYGYEALEKEIELILARTRLDTLLASEDYVLLESSIATLKSNILAEQLRNELNLIKNDAVDDWIFFNINLSTTKTNYLSMYQIIFISLIAGLLLSSSYFLIYRSYQDRKIKD